MSSPRLPSVKLIIKFCGVVAAIAAVAFAQLGPANWQFRTGLGWQTEHVLAYFVVTSIVCLAWPRPFVVGPAMMAAAILLEALQALTPDRSANFLAGLYGAGGALAAALFVELFTRAWRWRTPLKTTKIAGGLAVVAFAVLSLVPWELRPHTGAHRISQGEAPVHSAPPVLAAPLVRPARAQADRRSGSVKAPCDQTACSASCKEDEQILNTYALNPGGAIDFKDERNVTFRPKQRPTVLVLACIAVAQEPSVEDRGTFRRKRPRPPGGASVEDRACITAAAAKLPNVAALKIERSRALPQPSAKGRGEPKVSNVKVEIDVSVAGQSSTYVFNCVRDGQLVVIQPMGMR